MSFSCPTVVVVVVVVLGIFLRSFRFRCDLSSSRYTRMPQVESLTQSDCAYISGFSTLTLTLSAIFALCKCVLLFIITMDSDIC